MNAFATVRNLHKDRNLSRTVQIVVRARCWALATGLSVGALVIPVLATSPLVLHADPIAVLHREGTTRGFLIVRTPEGKTLAAGDLVETIKGNRVTTRLTFHFRDGSIDDDQTIFDQRKVFTLVSDHHIQKGRSFEHPSDVLIDVPSGNLTVKTMDASKEKVEVTHMDFPPDLSNGMELTILKNISPNASETSLLYLAATPKPRMVKLSLTPNGEDTFTVAGIPHKATHYVLKVELGGITGLVAPLIGKQPKNTDVWVVGGPAPAFVKSEGPFAVFGPLWTIEMSSPEWGPGKNSTYK